MLEELLRKYNEGRSMSFYCKVCSRMPVDLIPKAIKEARARRVAENVDDADIKAKAAVMKMVFKDAASEADIDLCEG